MGLAKWAALGLFVIQNAGVILLMRYSKVHSDSTGSYNSAVAVLMQEVTKVLKSCADTQSLQSPLSA